MIFLRRGRPRAVGMIVSRSSCGDPPGRRTRSPAAAPGCATEVRQVLLDHAQAVRRPHLEVATRRSPCGSSSRPLLGGDVLAQTAFTARAASAMFWFLHHRHEVGERGMYAFPRARAHQAATWGTSRRRPTPRERRGDGEPRDRSPPDARARESISPDHRHALVYAISRRVALGSALRPIEPAITVKS